MKSFIEPILRSVALKIIHMPLLHQKCDGKFTDGQ